MIRRFHNNLTIQAAIAATHASPNPHRRPPPLRSGLRRWTAATAPTTKLPTTPTTSSAPPATAPPDSSRPAAPFPTRSNSPTRKPPRSPPTTSSSPSSSARTSNWSTFQLGTIGFGSYVVNVPPGLTSYSTRVDATATLGVYVDIDASLNLSTGLLTVTFTSLDPTTLDTPSNPLVGFLPPDTDPPNGEGYINYTIQPKAGLATGATLDAQASIVFDTNAAIATPRDRQHDRRRPADEHRQPRCPRPRPRPSFTVSWSGSDGAGPGIAGYNVYVSDDGGAFTLWQSDTTATSATYTGQVGHTYALLQRRHRQRRPRPADADVRPSHDHGRQLANAHSDAHTHAAASASEPSGATIVGPLVNQGTPRVPCFTSASCNSASQG